MVMISQKESSFQFIVIPSKDGIQYFVHGSRLEFTPYHETELGQRLDPGFRRGDDFLRRRQGEGGIQ